MVRPHHLMDQAVADSLCAEIYRRVKPQPTFKEQVPGSGLPALRLPHVLLTWQL
jgi:hypothetical protein